MYVFVVYEILVRKPEGKCTRETATYIQGVTGGTDQTSGECSLGQTIPI